MDADSTPHPTPSRSWMVPFFTIWTGQAFSLLGSQLVQFALVWYLTQQTQSATILSIASLFAILPQVLISPFAGALVDRWNRRMVMIVADSSVALVTLALGYLFLIQQVQVWHIFVALLLRSAGGAFHWPAMQASTSLMVPKEQLSRIAGLNQTLGGLMLVAAPAMGALLLKLFPIQGAMWIDVSTAALAVLTLSVITIPQPEMAAETGGAQEKPTMMKDLREGFRYVFSWPGMLLLMIFASLLNFVFVPVDSLLALMVTQRFHGDVVELGVINSAQGIGMLAGGLALSAWGGFKNRITTSLVGVIGMGVGILTIGLAPANLFGLAVAGMALGGFMSPIVNGPVFAIIQSVVAPEKQGRVLSLLNATATAMSPLSLAIAGPVSDAVGIQTWYIAGGLLALAMGCIGFFVKPVMTIEEQKR